jgi:hypothetical protein
MGVKKIRFPETSGIGIKPISREGTERLVRKAIQYAIDNRRKSLTFVHKGNIMKFTEGAFARWGYALAQKEFGAELLDGGPWMKIKAAHGDIVLKDVIADAFLQQILLRPAEYDVIATMNLNGDYISDALAAQVGGIGIAPGANLSDSVAMFEATHGTAPKYAGKDYVNPGSEILSAEMMLRHMGWTEAADLIVSVDGKGDPGQDGDLRLRAADARRHAGVLLGLRPGDDRPDVIRAARLAPRQPKKPRLRGVFFACRAACQLPLGDVRGLLALRAGDHLEHDLLALLQGLEAVHLDGGEVREQIFAPVIRGDEAVTLGVVEPFHSACSHFYFPLLQRHYEASRLTALDCGVPVSTPLPAPPPPLLRRRRHPPPLPDPLLAGESAIFQQGRCTSRACRFRRSADRGRNAQRTKSPLFRGRQRPSSGGRCCRCRAAL